MLAIRTSEPLGRRKYWKMYEAAEAHGLPIGIHFGGQGGYPITGAGWPSYYVEDHAGMSTAFQSQVISYLTEGVFEQFPNLKIVLIEGGFAWVPALTWRMDKHWERMRKETPHVKRPPSEYVREHFWFTTQPIEEPENAADLAEIMEWVGYDRLMFSTDYPHWDFDDPHRAFKAQLTEQQRAGMFRDNAKALYAL
jgi:predicted TIM-barrel fold metal-dependent hydrolase